MMGENWECYSLLCIDRCVLLVVKFANDGLQAQTQLHSGWILLPLWRQPEGVFIIILKYSLFYFQRLFIISFLLQIAVLSSWRYRYLCFLNNHSGVTSNWKLTWLITKSMQDRDLSPQFLLFYYEENLKRKWVN